jgi:hypothetical protein
MNLWRNFVVPPAFACMLGTAALAQASTYTTVEAVSGKPTQRTYRAWTNKNCTPAALTTDEIAGGPQLRIPAQVVFYQSRPNYTGPDYVSYVVTAVNRDVAAYDVTITVKSAPARSEPGAKSGARI